MHYSTPHTAYTRSSYRYIQHLYPKPVIMNVRSTGAGIFTLCIRFCLPETLLILTLFEVSISWLKKLSLTHHNYFLYFVINFNLFMGQPAAVNTLVYSRYPLLSVHLIHVNKQRVFILFMFNYEQVHIFIINFI